ncbi:hypothetical protein PPERSA_00084 [Pseudocohnilembus persalinus]|uniref:Uncharacterized protein n=1 Tax=Pseudocohnilembus persalinus TaxID=266149 RepID=A0A0V0QY50_PSEPJ|nr:hypothetical protein PPERSA_00084 [Pseudocohnilembus persalinus]|eukprot:KRX07174.1 hypothetical protein PPERSA_00084 [Pseudocohnilembus persalinus]
MAIRNRVWGLVNQYINFKTSKQVGFLSGDSVQLAEKLEQSYTSRELGNQRENIVAYQKSQYSGFEGQKYEHISKYHLNGRYDERVSATDVLLQMDRIQVLQDLKAIEEQYTHSDPEYVRYSRLKARVLLEEPKAIEEYKEYASSRPYVKNYEKWINYKEYYMHHLLE